MNHEFHLNNARICIEIKFLITGKKRRFCYKHHISDFDVLLTVHLSIFILVINQLDAQNLFYNKFSSCLYMFRLITQSSSGP